MTHKRSRRHVLLAASAIGAVLAVLGSGTPGRAQSSQPAATLTIANSQWLDALRGKNLWNALLKYNEVAPNVTLKQEAIPASEYDNKITTSFSAGQGADIAIMQEGLFYAIADAGFLVDLSGAVGQAKLNDTNGNGLVKGKRLGIAWQRAVYALIYNKPLLDAAGAKVPTNVDELIAAAKSVGGQPGVVGFTARHQMNDFNGWFMDFQNWAYGAGVKWVDAKGKLSIDTPEALAAVKAFKAAYDAKIMPIGDSMPTQRTRFKERKVGFSIDNSGGTLNIASGGALDTKDLHSAPLPFAHPGAHQQIFLGLNRASKNQKAAIDFLAWVVSPAGQQALREASGPDALATDVPVTAAFTSANPWAQTFADLAKTSRSTLIPGYEVETGPIMRVVMEALERVMVSGADPKTALAQAQREVNSKF